jgi:hypothetical protein
MALADQVYGFYLPTVSLMGVGCSKETGAQAKALGATNLLIVTDAGLMKLGVADQIKKMINGAGLKATIFDGAEPNPTDKNVHDGVAAYLEHKCDGIVTLGGGSSHDCGKGIGLVVAGGGNIRDYEGVNKSAAADAAISRHQHDYRNCQRSHAFLHHHQYRHAREDGYRRLAGYAQCRHQRPAADGRHASRSDSGHRDGCFDARR